MKTPEEMQELYDAIEKEWRNLTPDPNSPSELVKRLRTERDDARRWAGAWKRAAKNTRGYLRGALFERKRSRSAAREARQREMETARQWQAELAASREREAALRRVAEIVLEAEDDTDWYSILSQACAAARAALALGERKSDG